MAWINDFGGPYCPCCRVSCGYGEDHHKCDCATCIFCERSEQRHKGGIKTSPNQPLIDERS